MKFILTSAFCLLAGTLTYAQVYSFCNDTMVCRNDGRTVPYQYAKYFGGDENVALVTKNKLKGVLNLKSGKELLPCEFERIIYMVYQPDTVLLKKNGLFYFFSCVSKKKIGPEFKCDNIADFDGYFIDGGAGYLTSQAPLVVHVNGKYGSITLKGKTIIPFEFDYLEAQMPGYNKINIAKKSDAYFLVDSIGKRLDTKNYTNIPGYWDADYIAAFKSGKLIFLDEKGNEHSSPTGSEKKHRAFIIDNAPVLLNTRGKKINKEAYDFDYLQEYDPYFIAGKGGKRGVIDTTGNVIVPFVYSGIDFTSGDCGNFFKVSQPGKSLFYSLYGLLDESGKTILEPKYDYISVGYFIRIDENEKKGFANCDGKIIIPAMYDDYYDCFKASGIAPVKLNNKWGFIDTTGKTVIPFKYTRAGYIRNGVSAVELDGKKGFVDVQGNETWE
ncbi:MAG TPA: WG repeat-containing protein [Flavobacteriales bacterium]|nr:WG repeat-containing protein [Flavobacteriales bacterium]